MPAPRETVERLTLEIAGRWGTRRVPLAAPREGLSVTDVRLRGACRGLALSWRGEAAPESLPTVLVALVPPGRRLPDEGLGLPDFIGLGAMRTGSTFLHGALRRHPAIHLPIFKELHFLDDHYPPGGSLPDGRRRSAATMRRYRERGLDRARQRLAQAEAAGRQAAVRWFSTYLSPPEEGPDWLWYASLLQPNRADERVGEVTPSYAQLDAPAIAEVVARLPDLKAIYTLRDPLERAWSHFLLRCLREGPPPEAWEESEILAFLEQPGGLAHGHYAGAIDRWQAALGPANLHLQFFDDLVADSAGLVARAQLFLGVPPRTDCLGEVVRNNRKGRSRATPPSPRVVARLKELYAAELARLRDRFGERVAHWGDPWG